MPRKFVVLDDFSGGINDVKDARDIDPNQLSACNNVIGDKQGQLRTVGGVTSHATIDQSTRALQSTYGLFSYATDHVKGASAADTGEDWIALCDNQIDIQLTDITTNTWFSPGSFEESGKIVFSFVDEVLRMSDAAFGATNKNKWYGYVVRTHFKGVNASANTGGRADYDGWYWSHAAIAKPGTYPLKKDTVTATTGNYPSGGDSFNIGISTGGADTGKWSAGTWQIAQSFIYDGNQESMLSIPPSSNTFTTLAMDKVSIVVYGGYADSTLYNQRISGARFYFREDGTDDPWELLTDISITEGSRGGAEGDYNPWVVQSAVTPFRFYTASFDSITRNIETYDILNGFSAEEVSIDLASAGEGYKTSVIANRRGWAANVKFIPKDGSSPVQMRDRIMYTPIGKFDTYPRSNYIDIITGDAEEFVALVPFADSLLAFKESTLYILNIASPSPGNWRKGPVKKFMGIPNRGAYAITDFGVVWANEYGCFIYDGKSIQNITRNRINDATWETFMEASSLIGYDPKKYQVVILGNSNGSAGNGYVYDLRTRSWWPITKPTTLGSEVLTNFVTDYNNELIIGRDNSASATIEIWDMDKAQTHAQDTIYAETKDMDFGNPGRLKKFYSVIATYKSGEIHLTPIDYYLNGSTSIAATTEDFTAAAGWKQIKVIPSSAQDMQSIKLRISNTGVTADRIELNDMSLEYRPRRKVVS